MEIDIAVGKYRNTKVWTNKKVSWDWIVNQCRETHRTPESYAEYMAMPNDNKDVIKASPGAFFGGYLESGARHNHTVKLRQLVTLDLDFATMDAWDDFQMCFSCEGLLYSTHKHHEDAARFRILIPLSRPVSSEEYEPIARMIAKRIGMKMFDATTFQIARYMYWPSSSRDADYVFEHQKGKFLDPDKILSAYVDWRDISAWPLCVHENDKVRKEVSQAQNPTEKKGLIGAFCRAYTIDDAINKFIPDKYETASDGRYTYVGASTAGGAIVYDDVFLFSWHNTDPAGSQLVNAFDLVRIHKFGHLDKDASKETTKLDSYAEMTEFIRRDYGVLTELMSIEGVPVTGDWISEMDASAKGVFSNTINNIVLILRNDVNLKDCFAFNEFESQIMVMGATPWNPSGIQRLCVDADDAGLRHYLERHYKIFQANKSRDALDIVAIENKFHPVRDYIDTLIWDGIPRLDTLLIDTLGAVDSAYTRAVTRKTLVAGIARVKKPGIKFDYILTTVGAQGLGKSTLFDELGGEWFSDSLTDVKGKDAYEQLQGSWLIEMAELSSLKRNEIETVKHFVTKRRDKFRVAYGRRAGTYPRQCIFLGNTNEWAFLRDPTGSRRFWPVAISKKYEHGTINVDQLWAEALHYYNKGEKIYLSKEMEAEAKEVQADHFDTDERLGLVDKYLNTPLPESFVWEKMSTVERRAWWRGGMAFNFTGDREREAVCVAEIWVEALDGDYKDMGTNNTKFIHAMMQNMPGWESTKPRRFGKYGVQRAYKRKGVNEAPELPQVFIEDFMN